ncbi:unnamed protein product [Enterobius vermicularis]|uniref:Protein kinase domain-containing protein n=1 Tax=Enterobius vermicularis TaxID=51028 RepID=A0A0N4UUJ0_ENTVE|nr:unnamed protein product [Enterobius vermicularis]
MPTVTSKTKFTDCDCAVKVLPEIADDIARSDFVQEINFMKTLQYHSHLVSMLGWAEENGIPMLLVEYCKQGDLLHLLRSKKDEIIKGYENNGLLKIRDLVSFGWQISNGLEYLSGVGCIHRDVAARNVLVDEFNVAKISDFGLCRLTDCLLYTGRGGRLPLKWMAPESLESFEYTPKSDVWSYGVLLYEIFSFGEVPYTLVETSELLAFLKSGKRLTRPANCPQEIYSLMMKCWNANAAERPSFAEICSTLIKIIENSTPNYGYVNAVNDYQQAPPSSNRQTNERSDAG